MPTTEGDPAWHGNLIISEYFHADNDAAIGTFPSDRVDWPDRRRDLAPTRRGPGTL
jgi:hypothetical protein